ncbi:hypothetical protein [Thermofilum sp.]|uniref:hypothetical protein n=1 Tax=Thermofilum sp. TaxID=1961369 RepID=UPI00315F7072
MPASIEAPPLPKDTPAPSARITSREVREAKEAPSVQDPACEWSGCGRPLSNTWRRHRMPTAGEVGRSQAIQCSDKAVV